MEIDIGKHCCLKNCKKLDYLPFMCEKCNLYFCLEHKDPELHDCKNVKVLNKQKKNRLKNEIIKQDKCFFKNCKKNTFHFCKLCKKNFCIEHRHQEIHNCIKNTLIDKKIIMKRDNIDDKLSSKNEENINENKTLDCCFIS